MATKGKEIETLACFAAGARVAISIAEQFRRRTKCPHCGRSVRIRVGESSGGTPIGILSTHAVKVQFRNLDTKEGV